MKRGILSAFLLLLSFLLCGPTVWGQSNQTATQALTLTVQAQALSITTTSLSNGIVGTAYSKTVSASGGISPYTFSVSVGTLPTGLTLSAGTGVISGTPSVAGTSTFTVKVTDSVGTFTTQSFTVVVYSKLVFSTTTVQIATINTPYTAAVSFTGGTSPYVCSLASGTLPTGLSVSTSGLSCVISGTPTQTGTFTFTLQVSDNSQLAFLKINAVLYARK